MESEDREMARKPRIYYAGALDHVMLCGNGETEVVTEDPNRHCVEPWMAEGIKRHGLRVHAYCWMSHHSHLAIEADIPLSKSIQNPAFRDARWFNQQVPLRYALSGGRGPGWRFNPAISQIQGNIARDMPR